MKLRGPFDYDERDLIKALAITSEEYIKVLKTSIKTVEHLTEEQPQETMKRFEQIIRKYDTRLSALFLTFIVEARLNTVGSLLVGVQRKLQVRWKDLISAH